MELKDRSGMTMISHEDLDHLHNLKHLFKKFRDTTAYMHSQIKENKPVDNLTSKLWRISDRILIELKKIG